MAIVLVVIGIVAALGLPLISQLVQNVKYSDSRDIVKGAIDSVTSWTAGKNRIPDLSGAANTADFRNVVKSPSDAFAQQLVYVYDNGSANTTNVCGISSTAITLKYSVGAVSYTINNVAFLVLSLSSNNKVDSTFTATVPVGSLNGAGGTSAVIPIPGGAANGTVTINADTYNDLVQWVTIDELRSKINCRGAELSIVNNELPYGYNGTAYSANVYANGGVGAYNFCIEDSVTNVSGATNAPTSMTFLDDTGNRNIPFYTAGGCNSHRASWAVANSVAITGTPWIIVSSCSGVVNAFICTQSHVSTNSNQACTGAGNTVWQQYNNAAGAINVPWAAGNFYLQGTNTLTFFMSDNGGNNAQKSLTFTVNPF